VQFAILAIAMISKKSIEDLRFEENQVLWKIGILLAYYLHHLV
jgi:hypothetical protein